MPRYYIESKGKMLATKESRFSFINSEPSDWEALQFNNLDKAVGFFINYVDAITPKSKIFYCKDDGFFYNQVSPFNIEKTKYRIMDFCL